MKKHYVKPVIVGEEFLADEYVSVCFGISCDYGETGGNTGTQDPINKSSYAKHTKRTSNNSGCGWTHNQYIVENGERYTMIEINTDQTAGGQPLNCQLYTQNWGSKVNSWTAEDLAASSDGTVYWSTTVRFVGEMYHKGQVVLLDANRANHS